MKDDPDWKAFVEKKCTFATTGAYLSNFRKRKARFG
jgi:hypothetical protein